MSNWYWAAANDGAAGERFVIAKGKDALWRRVRREIDADRRCAWLAFGIKPTLADCFEVWLEGRERYGSNYNRVTLELAQVPAFAEWLRSRPNDLCNYVSNPYATTAPLTREGYDPEVEARLRRIIGLEADT